MTADEARKISEANAPKPPDVSHFLETLYVEINRLASKGETRLADAISFLKKYRMPSPTDYEWQYINAQFRRDGYRIEYIHELRRLIISW